MSCENRISLPAWLCLQGNSVWNIDHCCSLFKKAVVQVTANAPLILWSQCSYQGGQKLLGLFPMFQQGYCFMQTNFWEGFEQLKNFCFQTVSFQFEIKARVVIFTNEYSKKIFLLLEVTLWYLQSSIWNPEKWEKVQEIKKWV